MPTPQEYQRVHGRGRRRPLRQRFFKGGDVDRLLTNWDTSPVHIDRVLRSQLRPLRARSREQARNNDYAKRYINLAKSNIVGCDGIRIRPQVKTNGELDTAVNLALESAFSEWGDEADVSGHLSFVDIQNLFVSSLVHDGEFVALAHYGDDVRLEVLDPELIATEKDRIELANGNICRLGIEYRGPRPVAVWMRKQALNGDYIRGNEKRIPMTLPNGMPQVFHYFLPEWVDQPRGIPWLATALYRLKMVDGYEDAAMIAARFGANKLGVITTETGEGYQGDGEDAEGRVLMDAEPGSFEQLPEGHKLDKFDPSYPHEQYGDFMKRTLMGLTSGLPGANYNLLASDPEGVNYSTMRQFAIEDREMFKCFQKLLIKFVKKFRNEAWLPIAKLQGVLDTRRSLESCKPASFEGRRWDWVDPEKEMRANQMAIENRLKSRSQIIRERGRDPDELFREMQEEEQRLKQMELL